jgi:hypothetical protein
MDPDTDLIERQRLSSLFESAAKFAHEANLRAAQVSIEMGKEKTQYFEKIALAGAGTIALVVSFVGAHAGRLQPAYLLRTALVVLFLGMFTAMFRNWMFPFYLFANFSRADMTAQRDRERCRKDLIVGSPAAIGMEDGKPIDVDAFLRRHAKNDGLFEDRIKKCRKREGLVLNAAKVVEPAALVLTVVGMGFLISLAWVNF